MFDEIEKALAEFKSALDAARNSKKTPEQIEKAKELYNSLDPGDRSLLEYIFPEVVESEDERIRKFLVKHVSEWIGCIEHDLKISSKDVESEEELAMFKAGLAYLERKKEQKPAEWSEEDENNIEFLVELLEEHEKGCKSDEYGSFLQERYESIIDWLKSLRPQSNHKQEEIVLQWEKGHPEPYKSVLILLHGNVVVEGEWNDETGRWYQYGFQSYLQDNEVDGWMNKKSLLCGNFNFQPHWYPSEEQMQGLRRGIVKADKGSDAKNAMVSLYNDLEKLM